MPQVKDGPPELNRLLERVYNDCMKKRNNPEKCSKIAWGAAKNAGWSKGKDGKWHKKGVKNDMSRELYMLDAEDDGACEWLKNEEGLFEFSDDDGSYSAVAVIGDRFYKGKFLANEEIEKAHKGMNGAFHDINHYGTSYLVMFGPNLEWIVGYQDDTKMLKNRMTTKIHIEDSAPKAQVWKSFMKICEKAGRVPNVSVSFWASNKTVNTKDLPEGTDWKSQGYKDDDEVPYLYNLDFRALSTVFKGACDDKAGCGVGITQSYKSIIPESMIIWNDNETREGKFVDLGELEKEKDLKEKLKDLKEENYE